MSLKAGISSAVVPEHEASKVVDLAAKPKTEVGIIEKAWTVFAWTDWFHDLYEIWVVDVYVGTIYW